MAHTELDNSLGATENADPKLEVAQKMSEEINVILEKRTEPNTPINKMPETEEEFFKQALVSPYQNGKDVTPIDSRGARSAGSPTEGTSRPNENGSPGNLPQRLSPPAIKSEPQHRHDNERQP